MRLLSKCKGRAVELPLVERDNETQTRARRFYATRKTCFQVAALDGASIATQRTR
jgi:hypothetical protein